MISQTTLAAYTVIKTSSLLPKVSPAAPAAPAAVGAGLPSSARPPASGVAGSGAPPPAPNPVSSGPPSNPPPTAPNARRSGPPSSAPPSAPNAVSSAPPPAPGAGPPSPGDQPIVATVTSPRLARALARALCALPLMPRGPVMCPMQLPGEYLMYFRAAGRTLPPVTVSESGCRVVTGLGRPRRASQAAFWTDLAKLGHNLARSPAGCDPVPGGLSGAPPHACPYDGGTTRS
jgi:hypothetical protein